MSLTEVLVAAAVLVACLLPALSLIASSRRQAAEAEEMLELIARSRAAGRPAPAGERGTWPAMRLEERIAWHDRELRVASLAVDGEGSYAPASEVRP